ncbi:MAG: SpoIID/LytB domain-containing protein [Acidimicrobiia bacterium]|nr:SpoIID/LytB domain-containing protein [Acidimicrobiia bacterium]
MMRRALIFLFVCGTLGTAVGRGLGAVTPMPGRQRSAPPAPTDVRRRPADPDRPVVRVPSVVRVGLAGPAGYAVRVIPLEEYVAGVLTGEAARDSDPAVLQALAIAARTYALQNLRRHDAEGFDVCDETHCQVLRRPAPATTAAADRTAGRVLTFRGALATVYYSASCGGHTQVPSAVWTGAEDLPYLPSRPEVGCGGDPVWNADVRAADIERTLRDAGFTGSLRRIRVLARDKSGRVSRLGLDGMQPSFIAGPDLRMSLGPTQIKSTLFDVHDQGERYVFVGRGYGHGVGMCVIGATRLAARGESAEALLLRYYPGTIIGMIETSGVSPLAADASVRGVPASPPSAGAPTGAGAGSGSANGATANGRRGSAATTSGAGAAGLSTTASAGTPGIGTSASGPSAAVGEVSDLDRLNAERRDLDALVASARAQLTTRLGLQASSTLSVLVHGSDQSYERATGRHWFTLGTVVGGTIHLMPTDQLRQRGVLERVIRREVAHALVDPYLSQRPQWVRDGAALHYADLDAEDAELRHPCPTDIELLQPLSAGALAQAYANARGCFARQVNRGRAWRDVR